MTESVDAPFTVRGFDAGQALLSVEWPNGHRSQIILPVDEDGCVPTGTALMHFVLGFRPLVPPPRPEITNAAEIEALVQAVDEQVPELSWDAVRQVRNELLRESDWTALGDAPLSREAKQRWRLYREDLRNITKQGGRPAAVRWPESPG